MRNARTRVNRCLTILLSLTNLFQSFARAHPCTPLLVFLIIYRCRSRPLPAIYRMRGAIPSLPRSNTQHIFLLELSVVILLPASFSSSIFLFFSPFLIPRRPFPPPPAPLFLAQGAREGEEGREALCRTYVLYPHALIKDHR